MTYYKALSVFTGAFLALLHSFPEISAASLYDPVDRLWELDSGNFERLVYRKNNVWIIEFYNSWCGHCIRFAPKWKEFAADIENWNRVVEIGAVNCNDPENVKVCRQYEVASYPTIKLLPLNLNGSEQGLVYEGSRDLSLIRHSLIDYLQSLNNTPSYWPDLNEIQASSIDEFWASLPSDVSTAYILLEPPDSYVGREVILDLSSKKHLVVKRAVTSNRDFQAKLVDNFDNSTAAMFFKLTKENDRKEVLNIFKSSANSTFMRDLIYETLTGKVRVKLIDDIVDPYNPDEKVKKGVYMADLENAIVNSLRQEVGVHADISGPAFTALKHYISALRMYFPGSPPLHSFLLKLNSWMNNRKGNLTGERFAKALENLQTKSEYLPDMHEFVGCKGSIPKYRGYPCSLWTLFHTLTVEAYRVYEQRPSNSKMHPQDVLFAIRGYVTHFFTCRECSKHFQSMAINLEKEVKEPRDTVLWLWRAHNKVNKRLSGDATEDPAHPKVQFPTNKDCTKCHIEKDGEEVQWDENAVFRYLQYYYKKENIKPVEIDDNKQFGESKNVKDLEVHVSIYDGIDGDSSTGNGDKLSDYFFILPILSAIRWTADS